MTFPVSNPILILQVRKYELAQEVKRFAQGNNTC